VEGNINLDRRLDSDKKRPVRGRGGICNYISRRTESRGLNVTIRVGGEKPDE